MTKTYTHRGLVWLNMNSPTDEEVGSAVRRYGLHPLVGEELRSEFSSSKISFYPEYILIVLILPMRIRKDGKHVIVAREIDFVIGKQFLITSSMEPIEQLEYFAKLFDTNMALDKDKEIERAGTLFYYMIKHIYSGILEDLENIKNSLEKAENHIFGSNERDMVVVLSEVNRELIDFKQAIRIHENIWEKMSHGIGADIFGPEFENRTKDVHDQFDRIHDYSINVRELLRDLRETNDSLLHTKQNEAIKTLTLMAFMTFPLSLIAAIFSLPSEHVPILGWKYDWLSIIAIMVVVSSCLLWYFKRKRWL